jgi:hypothetical protein
VPDTKNRIVNPCFNKDYKTILLYLDSNCQMSNVKKIKKK